MKCENNPLNNLAKMPVTPTAEELILWLTSVDHSHHAPYASRLMKSISDQVKEKRWISPKQKVVVHSYYSQEAAHNNSLLNKAGTHTWRTNCNADGSTIEICKWCGVNKKDLTINKPEEGTNMATKPIYYIAFTGHRPNKLGGYDDNSPKRIALRQHIEETLQRAVVKYGTTYQIIVISGGALGVDQDAARVAYKMNIPFIVAQPCKNHESKWPKESQIKYNKMLELAHKVVLVSDGTYPELGAKCMQDRNIWMVDHCDALIAVWDGTSGGTANCVQYAQKVGKPIVHINPNNLGGNSTNNTERTTS